jgi:signal transduction histidine kinase
MDEKRDVLHNELRKEFEESKMAFNSLQELNVQLRELNRKLEESERMKSHFISNIRNEIVNPFASIIGLALHIQTCDVNQLDTIKRMASMIYSEAFSLDFQLKNIFAAAEIEAGEIKLSYMKVSLPEIILSVVESYASEAAKRSIKVEHLAVTASQEAISDPDKLKLIVSNLLNNCIKYSSDGSSVRITSAIADGVIAITVTDSGIGISEEDQPHIFDRFKRLNTDINTQNSGYGLGLTVTKAIVEALSGTISLSSNKGVGSTFKVEIPEAMLFGGMDDFNADTNEIIFDNNGQTF